jgi:carboxypeptidase family protein
MWMRNSRFIIPQTAALLMVMVIGGMLVGCGLSGPGASRGALTGDVVAGPTCPFERVGQSCPPRPVPNREIQILDANGAVAATTKTDASGHFSLSLAPGAYVLHVAIVRGGMGVSQVTPGNVTIAEGKSTYIKIELDTGIR